MKSISTTKDAWPTAWAHNEALFKQMIEEKNCRFKQTPGLSHFVDSQENFVPFPVGYITYCTHPQNGVCVSVQGKNGWSQRCSWTENVIAWAVAMKREILAE